MTWTRLSDTFPTDPRFLGCSRDARLLHVEALIYCNAHLTDGVFPFGALARVTDSPAANAAAVELEDAGVWERDPDRNAWQVDWADQEAAEDVQARRRRIADKQKRYRDRKSRHEADDHTLCDSAHCPALRGQKPGQKSPRVTGNETRNVTDLVTHSPPLPSRPGGTETGTGDDAARGAAASSPPVVTSEPEPFDPEAEARRAALVAETHRALRSIRAEAKPDRPAGPPRRIQEPEPLAASMAEVVEDLATEDDEPDEDPAPVVVSKPKTEAAPPPAMTRTTGRGSILTAPPDVAEGVAAYERATASLANRKW